MVALLLCGVDLGEVVDGVVGHVSLVEFSKIVEVVLRLRWRGGRGGLWWISGWCGVEVERCVGVGLGLLMFLLGGVWLGGVLLLVLKAAGVLA